jgi:hypothetical protein
MNRVYLGSSYSRGWQKVLINKSSC